MNKSSELDFSGQDIFVGLDTHLKNWRVSIMVGSSFYKTFSQDPSSKVLRNYLKKNFPNANYYSAYEASFNGFKNHRDLITLGIKNIVVNPADIPTTDKERKQKEDSRDSRKIARQLSQKDLTPIYIPEIEIEGDRSLVRYRKTITKEISRTKNRVKSLLYYFGIEIPIQFSSWLREVKLPTESAKITMESYLETVELYRKKQYFTNKKIRELSGKKIYKENYDLLLSVPGIGCLTSMVILTELGDIKRFKNLDNLCSFIGLTPMTNSTGENERIGDITLRRNKILRTAIIESSWIAIRNDPVAKKLVNRILYVLKNRQAYVQTVVK